ncbi:MAG TPA: BsaWI family type II restriction enzyme [bacterium]|nr:BsaWI family type II restriction enzyme [bacterium]
MKRETWRKRIEWRAQIMPQGEGWNRELEGEYKQAIRQYFDGKIDSALEKGNSLEVGNRLAELLKSSEEDIVEIVTPRAVKKWASPETLPLWERFLENKQMVLELREIGKSIANSMRPLAGNNFAIWVTKVLNRAFQDEALPLLAVTRGEIRQNLNRAFDKYSEQTQGLKPDIDIVVVKTPILKPLAVISAKTTLAERVMQTISWRTYMQTLDPQIRDIKLLLVTAWETFSTKSANRQRVQQLDGVYVCNVEVLEWGRIKIFSKILNDLKALL